MGKNIAWFSEIHNTDVATVGGKGASLGEMYNNGFPIPPGFCVTADAYREFLEKTRLNQTIYDLVKNLNVNDNNALQAASKQIEDAILNAEMPIGIKNEIIDSYGKLDVSDDIKNNQSAMKVLKSLSRDPPFVACRSSATAEDLPSISKDEHILIKINDKTYFRRMEEIYDLVGDGDGYDIEIPAMKESKIQWVKVGSLYKHKTKKKEKMYKIKTVSGREIIVSPTHTLIVLNENTLEPKEVKSVKELKGNERVPAIAHLPVLDLKQDEIDVLDYINKADVVEENGILKIKNNSTNWKIQSGLPRKLKITKDFAYFLGVYCAEGSTYKSSGISVTNSDERIMERIIRFVDSLGLYNNQKINKSSLRFYNKTLVRFLNNTAGTPDKDIIGKGKICKNKKVPEFVFGWNKELIGEFLKGCFDGDGGCWGEVIGYCSTSKMLVSGIIKLLEMVELEWYLREKDNAFNIYIRPFSFSEFARIVGFESRQKQKELSMLIKQFNERKSHHEFLNSITISSELSGFFREKLEQSLPKQKILTNFCPKCKSEIGQTSYYLNKKRYYCEDCHKSFYEGDTMKKEGERYIYYDNEGKFTKNQVPWNKGNIHRRLGTKQLKNLLSRNNLSFETLNSSVKWDEIKEIKEIEYNDYVYDFCVPKVENFASGVGGIITHNSASFAGQQATFLNVKGAANVVKAAQKCWASLFTARAIYYRVKNNFDHMKVAICVVVQKMVNSDSSGVMFSVNPANNNDEIVIEAGWGLGEAIVSGAINPDNYHVNKDNFDILIKKINRQDWMFTKDRSLGTTVKKDLDEKKATSQVMTDNEIIELAKIGKKIENHYKKPMDMEFAIENGRIYIVQARPITTLSKTGKKEESASEEEGSDEDALQKAEVILTGLAVSPGVGSGPVKLIKDASELDKVLKGDVLVTRMTDPDMVPAMERAAAIVTDEGGVTCHAAIVSREMGVPCVVGTNKATQMFKDGDEITIDGTKGKVYRGIFKVKAKKAASNVVYRERPVTRIKTITDLPEFAQKAADTGADGVGLVRIEFMIVNGGTHPSKYVRENRDEEYISLLMNGLRNIAKPFGDKPVWVRTSDIRTDEYRNLKGGSDEPKEDNPMIGWHGIRRGLTEDRIIRAEFTAIMRLHREGLKNIGIMLPFVIKVEELQQAKKILREVGLEPRKDIDFGVMIETPASCWIIEELCKEGIDFISFGTNDLTQLTLGIDRNNDHIQKDYDEMHPAVLREVEHVIKVCRKYGVKTSICGQAGSNPIMAKKLVSFGIDSISVNVDAIDAVREAVSFAERQFMLEEARKEAEKDDKEEI